MTNDHSSLLLHEKSDGIYVCVFATMKQVQLLLLRLYFMPAH